MQSNGEIFAQDSDFWDNYLIGRPKAPESLFDRIFSYHQSKGGAFGTAHDVGAGNGPYAQKLRSRFARVIVSDIVAENVELARRRLAGSPGGGFSFRVAKLQDADDIEPGSVDMVFATNVMHFPDPQGAAMATVARQLRPGGTFAAAQFGPVRFHEPDLQDLWARISHEGGRQLLKGVDDPSETIRVMGRTQGTANIAPLSPEFFLPGAQRIHLNMDKGGIQGVLPPEETSRDTQPDYTGPGDVVLYENEEGWTFEADLAGVKAHFGSFPFVSQFPGAFEDLYKDLEALMAHERIAKGYFPAKIILATRC
ncbi:hypothetical protein INS49_012290 [Diaporthe citri]|uniref:uncharacterized protein n=1 Tax=Diaporthe citri TaxID=83186 RepID=UPI001C7EE175|nr:uncharacterized protein INS49_012290 [Diaporthe citri]KAG6358771.1 hypothetical protein INS49_012290 [Diaporthe citri]